MSRSEERRRRVVGGARPEIGDAPTRFRVIALEVEPPGRIHALIRGGVGCGITGAGIDEITVVTLRRRCSRMRCGRAAAGEGQHDDDRQKGKGLNQS